MVVMVMFVETRMSIEDVAEHWGLRLLMGGDDWRDNSDHLVKGLKRRRKAGGRLLTRW
jgi:hypothetical protein